jgi:flavodoxin
LTSFKFLEKEGDRVKALVVYWSATGNTAKVAQTIQETLEQAQVDSKILKLAEAGNEDFREYDLIFFGAPPYQFTVPDPVLKFIKEKMKFYRDRGDVKPTAPKIPGKRAVVFCTFSGPHTGIREAIPAIKTMGQLFEHIGFNIAGEWYIVGEFHNEEILSTKGLLGDIRGRPNKKDLVLVKRRVKRIINSHDSH